MVGEEAMASDLYSRIWRPDSKEAGNQPSKIPAKILLTGIAIKNVHSDVETTPKRLLLGQLTYDSKILLTSLTLL